MNTHDALPPAPLEHPEDVYPSSAAAARQGPKDAAEREIAVAISKAARSVERLLLEGFSGLRERAERPHAQQGQITREKEAFVYEAGQRENRLMRILVAMQGLKKDKGFVAMLKTAGLAEAPQLKGEYAV